MECVARKACVTDNYQEYRHVHVTLDATYCRVGKKSNDVLF
jgi:hypothetical protein